MSVNEPSVGEVFTTAAEHFGRWTALLWDPMGQALTDQTAPALGEAVLDVCCGVGLISAARRSPGTDFRTPLAAALMFPFVGGIALISNRASDVVANGSAHVLEGDVPQVSTMLDAAGNPIARLYSQRRFDKSAPESPSPEELTTG